MDRNIERSIDRPIERLIDFRSADIVASGPIASAPVASEALLNSYFIQTDDVAWPSGRLLSCRGVFDNRGVDFVDWGKPAFRSQLRPRLDTFTACLIYAPRTASNSRLMGISTGFDNISQMYIGVTSSLNVTGLSGGQLISSSTPSFVLDRYRKITLTSNQTTQKLYIDKSLVASGANGTTTTDQNILIGRDSSGGNNGEGYTVLLAFFAGENVDGSTEGLTLIDMIDFNDWNGTANGVSKNLNPYTVTDGSPFTAKSYGWVPTDLMC